MRFALFSYKINHKPLKRKRVVILSHLSTEDQPSVDVGYGAGVPYVQRSPIWCAMRIIGR